MKTKEELRREALEKRSSMTEEEILERRAEKFRKKFSRLWTKKG